jgi:hypothetical protein
LHYSMQVDLLQIQCTLANSLCHKILSRDCVTINEVWIGNRIYWKLTDRNYKYLRQSDSVTHFKDHCNYSTYKVFTVFTNRCLVAASTADIPLPLGSQTVPSLSYQLLASHNCRSTNHYPCYIALAWTAQKTSLPLLHALLLPGKQHVHRAVP